MNGTSHRRMFKLYSHYKVFVDTLVRNIPKHLRNSHCQWVNAVPLGKFVGNLLEGRR